METPLWLTALFNIEHFSFVSSAWRDLYMKGWCSASDITDIICLSEGVPAGHTPLKQLVTKQGVQF